MNGDNEEKPANNREIQKNSHIDLTDNPSFTGIRVLKYWGDEREAIQFCCYCGGPTESIDHIPSKVFLDKPYPSNLIVVPACKECNESYSLDEEYVACLIECAKVGSCEPKGFQREKIKEILSRKPHLAERINRAHRETLNGAFFFAGNNRILRIILKLSKGHAAFELNRPVLHDPQSVSVAALHTLSSSTRRAFETPPTINLFPEVGTRAFQRVIEDGFGKYIWITAQPGRYRYLTAVNGDTILVRIVIGEYLACEVFWDEEYPDIF